MIRRLIPILFSTLLMVGCSAALTENQPEASILSKTPGEDDTPILFLNETDPDYWQKIEGLDSRFRACNIPADVLNTKTTSALGRSILHYPLNHIIFAYNYWDMPVRLVYDNSLLHQALAIREDAAPVLLDIFDRAKIDLNSSVSSDYEVLTLTDELFLEMFIGSRLVPGLDTGVNKERLKAIVSRKASERKTGGSYTEYSLIPLAYINERLGLGLSFDNDIVELMHKLTLRD